MIEGRRPFQLVPRSVLRGAAFGNTRSTHRGTGAHVVGTRPYRPGDAVRAIDWAASARLSAARDADEFVVRETFADEAPRVCVVLDGSPSMRLYGEPFPWLDKSAAALSAVEAIAASVAAARSDLGLVSDDVLPPGAATPASVARRAARQRPAATLAQALGRLLRRRSLLPPGSFLFLVSDFLAGVPALPRVPWDVVPVVVQDPTWEQSFPPVGGVTIPYADAASGAVTNVRLSARAARARQVANEHRLATLVASFGHRAWDPVVLGSAEDEIVDRAFAQWADRRRAALRRVA